VQVYRIRYVCDSSLRFERDVTFDSRGRAVTILFSAPITESKLHVVVDAESENCAEAVLAAQGSAQPVLDALSFVSGTPLLLRHWDFVLKGQSGSRTRQAIWCNFAEEPSPRQLAASETDEAQRILNQPHDSLELCWHRYALQRGFILDRFLFQWLAFEGLAGKKQIPTVCPHCKEEVSHCEKPLLHEGSSRENAYALFSQADPEISRSEFTREIWGSARNSVFHGTVYPSPKLFSRLNVVSPKLRIACDIEFNKRYETGEKDRPKQDLQSQFYKYHMIEWETKDTDVQFARDFPWEAVIKDFGNMGIGEVRMRFPKTSPFKDLDFRTASLGW